MAKSVETPRVAGPGATPEIEIPATPQWLQEVVEWWFAGFMLAARLPALMLGHAYPRRDTGGVSAGAAQRPTAKPSASRREPAAAASR